MTLVRSLRQKASTYLEHRRVTVAQRDEMATVLADPGLSADYYAALNRHERVTSA